MSAIPSPSLESAASTLPQVRLATQAEFLSTQVQDRRRTHNATTTRDIQPTSNGPSAAARATLQMLCDTALNTRPGPQARTLSSGDHSTNTMADDNEYGRDRTAKRDQNRVHLNALYTRGIDHQQGSQVDLKPNALKRLRSIWDNEEHFGVPIKWRAATSDVKVLIPYLNICQQVKKQGKLLSSLWTNGTRYLEAACEDEGRLCPRAIEKAAKRIRGTQILPPGHPLAPSSSIPEDMVASPPGNPGPQPVKHSAKDKKVVRRFTKVPKDQISILECPQSHYPPLPGQDTRPGALPVKLLDLFTAQVDEAALSSEPGIQTSSMGKQLNRSEETVRHHKVDEQLEESSNSEEEVTASQWPASPDRGGKPLDDDPQEPESSRPPSLSPVPGRQRKAELPPDSSPLEDYTGLESVRNHTESEDRSTANESLEPSANDRRSPLQPSPNPGKHRAGSMQSGTIAIDYKTKESAYNPASDDLSMRPRDPEQTCSSGDVPVQIKRTPYPGRHASYTSRENANKQKASPVAVDGPASTFIPSTYCETTHNSAGRETHSHRVGTTVRSGAELRASRGNTSVPDAEQSRFRGDSEDKGLTRKLQDAREYRRSVLEPISKKESTSIQPTSKPECSRETQHHQQSSTRVPSSEPQRVRGQSADADTATAPTSFSVPAEPKQAMQDISSSTAAESATRRDGTAMALFQRFSDAYPDYDGSKRQFERACQLLSKHCSRTQLHSFLLDDFVFHYTESYLDYLAECQESGGEPLLYADYFNGVEPTHMKKIISLSVLQHESPSKGSRESITAGQRKSLASESRSARGDGSNESAINTAGVEDEAAAASRAVAIETIPSISPVLEQHLDPSQKSSVEEWLQQTVATRAASPELGTPDIDRSLSPVNSEPVSQPRSLKRPFAADLEHSSTTKRTKLSPTTGRSDKDTTFVKPPDRQRLSLPQAGPSNSKPSHQLPSSTAPATGSIPKPRRSLPASFSSSQKNSTSAVAPVLRAASSSLQTPSKTPRQHVATQPLRANSKPSGSTQKPSHASKPVSASPFVKPAKINLVKPVDPTRSQQDEDTPFKRFAASWRKLPALTSAAPVKQSAGRNTSTSTSTSGPNPYALVDVTQWRK